MRIVGVGRCIVYCNGRRTVDKLAGELREKGVEVGTVHGEMEMREREQVVTDMREGRREVLVTTDMLSISV